LHILFTAAFLTGAASAWAQDPPVNRDTQRVTSRETRDFDVAARRLDQQEGFRDASPSRLSTGMRRTATLDSRAGLEERMAPTEILREYRNDMRTLPGVDRFSLVPRDLSPQAK
jgi:hypothetical protein